MHLARRGFACAHTKRTCAASSERRHQFGSCSRHAAPAVFDQGNAEELISVSNHGCNLTSRKRMTVAARSGLADNRAPQICSVSKYSRACAQSVHDFRHGRRASAAWLCWQISGSCQGLCPLMLQDTAMLPPQHQREKG